MATPLDQLRWALQALAAPAERQIELFPSFVCIPDELVLDFDQWLPVAAAEVAFTPEQQGALDQLAARIDAWSGSAHPEVWEQGALRTHSVWGEFRGLSAAALAAFGWPAELPPTDRGAIYVRSQGA
jgi:hypothetical protein